MNFPHLMHSFPIRSLTALWATALAALLAACSTPTLPPAQPPVKPAPTLPTPPQPAPAPPVSPTPAPAVSQARTEKEYRQDAAAHLYKFNAERIYKGRLPPMLYAIGVLDVELDRQGRVVATRWKRAPSHAPEVVAEIEQTVRKAAPFPIPARLGKAVYTDVWLWHKSGKFQLDTLTEGQD